MALRKLGGENQGVVNKVIKGEMGERNQGEINGVRDNDDLRSQGIKNKLAESKVKKRAKGKE